MKIQNTNGINPLITYQKTNRARDAYDVAARSEQMPRDGVRISLEALELASQNGAESAARNERLATVKEQIADGTYQVKSDEVVRRMLAAYGEF